MIAIPFVLLSKALNLEASQGTPSTYAPQRIGADSACASVAITLLADPEHRVAEQYGVWKERNMYGKKSMGIERSTFVIDAEGNVAKAMRRVKPDEHAAQVLEAL